MLSLHNKVNSTISIQTQIELEGNLNIANLSKKLDKINLPKQTLQQA